MFFLGIKISASYFYPRPPGGGRPSASKLIVEKSINFYPRPPGGGRRLRRLPALNPVKGFLSTPSGWRATGIINLIFMRPPQFLSTPSGWRATGRRIDLRKPRRAFLSTPSGWRATRDDYIYRCIVGISIHALRVEGDFFNFFKKILIFYDFYPRPPGGGRLISGSQSPPWRYFYPRPPGGGRRRAIFTHEFADQFLSTPSGWRATDCPRFRRIDPRISIHALRVEGDLDKSVTLLRTFADFYPRPPGGGRPI